MTHFSENCISKVLCKDTQMEYKQAILLAIIEGITEYLPVSSTGHMIVTSYLLGIEKNDFVKNFEVIIQFGAILSVLTIYWRDFLKSFVIYKKLLIAFLPAGILGFLLKNKIEQLFESVQVVAWATIVGGVILIWLDRWVEKRPQTKTIDSMTMLDAFKIGIFQTLALIPGTSRSGSTIAGGMIMSFSRVEAAKFSFFLAVPTLTAATCLKLIKIAPTIQKDQINLLLLGSLVAFIVAWAAVKTFIGIVSKTGFKYFAIYRIIIGIIILILA